MKKINTNNLPRSQKLHAKEVEGCLTEHGNSRGDLTPDKNPCPSNWLESSPFCGFPCALLPAGGASPTQLPGLPQN